MADPITQTHSRDGGFKSRKFILTLVSLVLVSLGGLAACKWSVFQPMYSTFVGGILGALGIYFGANVGTKHVTKGSIPADPEQSPAK